MQIEADDRRVIETEVFEVLVLSERTIASKKVVMDCQNR